VEIAGVVVQTVRRMFHGFRFQISVCLNCLVSPMPKDIVVLLLFIDCHNVRRGLGSSVGITTAYGLEGPGIESLWGRDFPHLSIPSLRPTQPPVQ
jgi:hypothetical protein